MDQTDKNKTTHPKIPRSKRKQRYTHKNQSSSGYAVIASIFILPHIVCQGSKFGPCYLFVIQYLVSFLDLQSSWYGRENWLLTLIVFLMSCDCKCYVALLRYTRDVSAVCDCGLSWLYIISLYSLVDLRPVILAFLGHTNMLLCCVLDYLKVAKAVIEKRWGRRTSSSTSLFVICCIL